MRPIASRLAFTLCALSAGGALAAPLPCLVEANTPELLPEAETAGVLTCDALRARGLDVGSPTPGAGVPGPAVRVSLHRRGKTYLLRVAREDLAGQPDATRSMRIEGLGDVERAAPRIAEALTGGRNVPESQMVGTLTAAEGERLEHKKGEFMWGFGLFGLGVLGAQSFGGFGFQGLVMYETEDFGAVAAFRIGSEGEGAMTDVSIGGRYFFSRSNSSAFVGGGLGVLLMDLDDGGEACCGRGLAGYVDLGTEFLRLHSTRLILEVRLALPLFKLGSDSVFGNSRYEDGYDGDAPAERPEPAQPIYAVPATVGVSYVW